MRILQPSFKFLGTFLDSNPELTQKYVDTSVTAISHLLGPLNVFMRHLLVVKGLDPDSNPGERAARELRQAMNQAFETHQKAYDDDYDFSWVQKRFDETRNHLKDLQLTKEKYLDLTNLAKLPDEKTDDGDFTLSRTAETKPYEVGTSPQVTASVVNDIAPVSPKREIRMTAEEKAINAIKGVAEKLDKFDPLTDLRAALDTIEKELKLNEKPKTPKKRNKTFGETVTKRSKKIVKVGDHYALTGGPRSPEAVSRLVDEMVAKGLCADAPEAKVAQIQEMASWKDDAVESLKRILDRQVSNALDKHLKPETVTKPKFRGSFRRVTPKGQ